MYFWKRIENPADFLSLSEVAMDRDGDFVAAYNLGTVGARLASALNGKVKAVLVEFNYVDKDYRSTYYHFYAKKGRRYRADCLRLHFFDGDTTFEATTLALTHQCGEPDDHYLGFVTVRPTFLFTIGRSILDPRVRIGMSGKVIISRHKVHLLGYDYQAKGFPWMQQHSDISVCAHTACWAIVRHYSERYRKYHELLTHDITRLAHPYDPGGIRPSRGLQIAHAERIFSEAGNYPVVSSVAQDMDTNAEDRKLFMRQLFAYLDSGFPLFLAVAGEHAVAAIGYQWKPGETAVDVGPRNAWDMVDSIIVADDNHLPYIALAESTHGQQRYTLSQVHAFIAPLPEKIFYPADAVETVSADLATMLHATLPFPNPNDMVVRYFVTTAASLRRHMRKQSKEFTPEMVNIFMQLSMAQFVWVVEYSSLTDWNANRVGVRAIIDATASPYDNNVLWAVYGRGVGYFFDRENGKPPRKYSWDQSDAPHLSRIETNLCSFHKSQ